MFVRGNSLYKANTVLSNSLWDYFFFIKRFIAQKIQRDAQGYKTVPLTNLP
jgi:hypothetical protein